MELSNRFFMPVGPEDAWESLLDFEKVARSMPGATLTRVDGDDLEGSVVVKLGPMRITYEGTARIITRDRDGRRLVMEANGKETRGSGTASARVEALLEGSEGGTEVTILSSVDVSGRPAQMGAGMIEEVGQRLIDEFSGRLAQELAATTPSHDREEVSPPPIRPSEALDLGAAAAGPLMRRVRPVLIALAAVALVVILVKAIRG